MYIINDSHLMYCYWDIVMEFNEQSFLSFWKKWTKCLEILSFYTCVPKMTIIMMYGYWDIEQDRQNSLSFWTIFCPFIYPLKNLKNQNFEKKKKAPGDTIILHKCTINDNHPSQKISEILPGISCQW